MSKRPGSSLSIPKGGRRKKGIDSSRVCCDRARENGFKEKSLHIRKMFSTVRVVARYPERW